MSVSLKQSYDIEYDGARNVARMDIYIDDASDLTGLDDIDDIYFLQGSDALDISTGDHYLRNSSGSWILQPSAQYPNAYTKTEIDQMLTDYYTKAEADALFEWRSFSMDGISTITFIAMGSPLTGWTISGDMIQTGTPTPTSPIYPDECGDYVSDGDHAGKYTIPITCGETTVNSYLDEPIRKISNYVDTEGSTGTVTRKIRCIDLGDLTWTKTGSGNFNASLPAPGVAVTNAQIAPAICSHFAVVTANAYGSTPYTCAGSVNNVASVSVNKTGYENLTAAEFKVEMAGVKYWYALVSATAETFDAPTITPDPGENTLTVGTTTPPNEITITGQIRET